MRSSAASPDRFRRAAETALAAAREGRLPPAVILHGGDLPRLAAFALGLAAVHLRAPAAEGHIDFLQLLPSGKARVIRAEDVYEVVRLANLSSHSGRKVILLREADRLREEGANALLKTLEEPAPGILLLLVTLHPNRLLPTIVSRCARFAVGGESESLALPAWRDWLADFGALLARAADRSRPASAAPLLLAEAYGLLTRFEPCHEALVGLAAAADPVPDFSWVESADERADLREAHESRLARAARTGMLAEMAEAVRAFARAHPAAAAAAADALGALEQADQRAHRLNLTALVCVESALLLVLRRLARA